MIGIHGFSEYRRNLRLQNATELLRADLLEARSGAHRTSSSVKITPVAATARYTIERDTSVTTRALPDGVRFASHPGDADTVTFNAPYGLVEASNNTMKLVASDGRTASVHVVGMSGKIVVKRD